MLKFNQFTASPDLIPAALILSAAANVIKQNLEANSLRLNSITDTTRTVDSILGPKDLISPCDASSSSSGGLTLGLPAISSLTDLKAGFYFKKLDTSRKPVNLIPSGADTIEQFRSATTTPTATILSLDLPDQAVLLYPVGSSWRIFQHTLNMSSLAVRAYNTTNQTIAANTATRVNFNSEDYDRNGDFNASNSTYTTPTDGYYLVTGSVGTYSTSGIRNMYLTAVVDTATTRLLAFNQDIQNNRDWGMAYSTILKLTKGQVLEIQVVMNQNGNVRPGSVFSFLEIQFLTL